MKHIAINEPQTFTQHVCDICRAAAWLMFGLACGAVIWLAIAAAFYLHICVPR